MTLTEEKILPSFLMFDFHALFTVNFNLFKLVVPLFY